MTGGKEIPLSKKARRFYFSVGLFYIVLLIDMTSNRSFDSYRKGNIYIKGNVGLFIFPAFLLFFYNWLKGLYIPCNLAA